MYRWLVARKVRNNYAHLNRGDYDAVVKGFAPDVRWLYNGESSLAGELRGAQAVRDWFREAFRLVPGVRFEAREVLVGGPPWNMRVAVMMTESARLADESDYVNTGVQLLGLRWGRVTEDIVTWFDQPELRRALDVGASRVDPDVGASS